MPRLAVRLYWRQCRTTNIRGTLQDTVSLDGQPPFPAASISTTTMKQPLELEYLDIAAGDRPSTGRAKWLAHCISPARPPRTRPCSPGPTVFCRCGDRAPKLVTTRCYPGANCIKISAAGDLTNLSTGPGPRNPYAKPSGFGAAPHPRRDAALPAPAHFADPAAAASRIDHFKLLHSPQPDRRLPDDQRPTENSFFMSWGQAAASLAGPAAAYQNTLALGTW